MVPFYRGLVVTSDKGWRRRKTLIDHPLSRGMMDRTDRPSTWKERYVEITVSQRYYSTSVALVIRALERRMQRLDSTRLHQLQHQHQPPDLL